MIRIYNIVILFNFFQSHTFLNLVYYKFFKTKKDFSVDKFQMGMGYLE